MTDTTIVIPAHLRPYVCSIAGTRLHSASYALGAVTLGVWPTPYLDMPADPQTVEEAQESREQWRKWDRVIDELEHPQPGQPVTLEKEIALDLIAEAISDLKENNLISDAPLEAHVINAQALVDLATLEAGALREGVTS